MVNETKTKHIVRVTQLVDDRELHFDDQEDWGLGKGQHVDLEPDYGSDKETVLDWFHNSFPVKVLDDFDIRVDIV